MNQTNSNKTKKLMLFGIFFCIFYLLCCSFFNTQLMHWLHIKKVNIWIMILSRIMQWTLLLLMIVYAVKIEKQPLLLWKNNKYKIHILLLHILLIYVAVIMAMIPVRLLLYYGGLHEFSQKLSDVKSIMIIYPLTLPFFAITAGIVEEYIFRGFMQPRLERIFKSPVAGILINALLFSAIHYGYGTFTNVIGPFVIGIVFSIYYWKYRNIYTLIVCHTIIDLIALTMIVHSPKF